VRVLPQVVLPTISGVLKGEGEKEGRKSAMNEKEKEPRAQKREMLELGGKPAEGKRK